MNRVNSLTAERAEDQREILDIILEGNRRIVETIKEIRDISQNQQPKKYEPLARKDYNEKHKETIEMQKPVPPKMPFNTYQQPKNDSVLEQIFQDISNLRSKIEQYGKVGICGKAELTEFENDLYQIQNKIYEASLRA
jgi:signal transduction histidine kinase